MIDFAFDETVLYRYFHASSVSTARGRRDEKQGKLVNGIERLLYITGKTGVGIYDINDNTSSCDRSMFRRPPITKAYPPVCRWASFT